MFFFNNYSAKDSQLSKTVLFYMLRYSYSFSTGTKEYGKVNRQMFYIVEDHLTHPDIGDYTSYGIGMGNQVVHDISTDRSFVEALVQRFIREALEPEHLYEAVEDAITFESILSVQ